MEHMNNQGKLFCFIGPSGHGKDFFLKPFIKYCGSKGIKAESVIKYFTRKARNDETDSNNMFGIDREELLQNPNIVSARINGELTGVDVQDIKDKLEDGINIALQTGSFDLIYELAKRISEENIRLIYVVKPELYSITDYFKLESKRATQNDMSFTGNHLIRFMQQRYIHNQYLEWMDMFAHTYMNGVLELYNPNGGENPFFNLFFESILSDDYNDGVCWVGNDEQKQRDGMKRFIDNYEKQNFDFEDIIKDVAQEIQHFGSTNINIAMQLMQGLDVYAEYIPGKQELNDKNEKAMPEDERLTSLFQRLPQLKKYMHNEWKHQEGFSGTKADRIFCLFIAGEISIEDIKLLIDNGVSFNYRLEVLEKLNNKSQDIMKDRTTTEISAIEKLWLPSVKEAFSVPLDEATNYTVYDNLGELVKNRTITPEEFGALVELRLVPIRMINPKSRIKFKKEGIIKYPRQLELNDNIGRKMPSHDEDGGPGEPH